MIIHHGMLPNVEQKSYIFIPDNHARPATTIAMYKEDSGWRNYQGCKICTQEKNHPCTMVDMEFHEGMQLKREGEGSYELRDGDWVLKGRDSIFTEKKIHYPPNTTPCAELPVGTLLFRYASPGKWLKKFLLVSGEWESKNPVLCPKKGTCNEKLPFSPMSGDCLTSSCGRHKFEYSFREGWLYKNTVHRSPKIVSEVLNFSGTAYAHAH